MRDSHSLSVIDIAAHIGGRAHILNGSRVWLWSDDTMIYNETKYKRYDAFPLYNANRIHTYVRHIYPERSPLLITYSNLISFPYYQVGNSSMAEFWTTYMLAGRLESLTVAGTAWYLRKMATDIGLMLSVKHLFQQSVKGQVSVTSLHALQFIMC